VDLLAQHEKLVDRLDWEGVSRLILYQEPSMIGWSLGEIIVHGRNLAYGLVGEVLDEEDLLYTRRINAILAAVSLGKNTPTEIASYLYSHGYIPSQSPTHLPRYIDAAIDAGLLERIPVYGTRRRTVQRHVSPLTDLSFYLDARHAARDIPYTRDQLLDKARERIPFLFEVFVERALSQLCSLRPVKILRPNEIDIALVDRKGNLVIAGEVKMKEELQPRELARIKSRLLQANARYHVLVSLAEDPEAPAPVEHIPVNRLAQHAGRSECPVNTV